MLHGGRTDQIIEVGAELRPGERRHGLKMVRHVVPQAPHLKLLLLQIPIIHPVHFVKALFLFQLLLTRKDGYRPQQAEGSQQRHQQQKKVADAPRFHVPQSDGDQRGGERSERQHVHKRPQLWRQAVLRLRREAFERKIHSEPDGQTKKAPLHEGAHSHPESRIVVEKAVDQGAERQAEAGEDQRDRKPLKKSAPAAEENDEKECRKNAEYVHGIAHIDGLLRQQGASGV
ncbi:protein of unknown function [Ruminococcaceae bacterium BL-6]|nr:protein of unknown function [Ruminococcaceae bacterium BL-6]